MVISSRVNGNLNFWLCNMFITLFHTLALLYTLLFSNHRIFMIITSLISRLFLAIVQFQDKKRICVKELVLIKWYFMVPLDKEPTTIMKTMHIYAMLLPFFRVVYCGPEDMFICWNCIYLLFQILALKMTHFRFAGSLFTTVTASHFFAANFLIGKPLTWFTYYAQLAVPFTVFSLAIYGIVIYSGELMCQLRKTNNELETSSNAKSRFLSTIGHEVRTPLNSIIGHAELILHHKNRLDSEQKEHLTSLLDSANILLESMNSMLEFAKLEMKGVNEPPSTSLFDLRELTNKLVNMFQCQTSKKNIHLLQSWVGFSSQQDHVYCEGDSARVKTILMNLLSNACKFTHQGQVVLKTEKLDDKHLQFTIEDTGIGIDESFAQYMFVPFSQQTSTSTMTYGGSGLGLSICKKIADQMHGSIYFKSKMGVGTTFFVTLPLKLCEKASPPIAPRESATIETKELSYCGRVLIVDDNEVSRKVLRKMLENLNVPHDCASSGFEAIELYRKSPYHIVLMDIEMPGISGLETAKNIRQLDQDRGIEPCCIVLVSGNDQSNIDSLSMQIVNGFLQKPLRLEQLKRLLVRYNPRMRM